MHNYLWIARTEFLRMRSRRTACRSACGFSMVSLETSGHRRVSLSRFSHDSLSLIGISETVALLLCITSHRKHTMVASTFTEKRLLWHPRQGSKFVVGGGSDITLYEWAADQQEIRHVTAQHDLQFMKVGNYSSSGSQHISRYITVFCLVSRPCL
jgi:hypothetical protein